MPINMKILMGPETAFPCSISRDPFCVLFKRKYGQVRVDSNTKVCVAWAELLGYSERVPVFRSRVSDAWLGREDFDAEKTEMRALRVHHIGLIFTSPKGFIQVAEPAADGTPGWRQSKDRRVPYIFTDGHWIAFRRASMESWA